MAGNITTPALAWAHTPGDVVYFIKKCADLNDAPTITKGTIYKVSITEATAAAPVVVYSLKTDYSQNESISDPNDIFTTKALALTALDALIV